MEEFALPSEQLNLSDRELFGVRKNDMESKKKNNIGEVQPSSIQDIITNQGQGRKMKTETRVEGEVVASQAAQPLTQSKSVAELGKEEELQEETVDEWSISAPAPVVDEWSVPTPTTGSFPPTSEKDEKIDEIKSEPRRSSKADSWSLSPEKEEEVSHPHCHSLLFFHAFMFQVDDWSIPAPTDDWSAPPKGELSISPQHKDDWCLSSPKEILNKDEWCLSSPKENLNKDEWCLSPPKEILNSPVDEWSLPPVVPKEIADKGDDEKVPKLSNQHQLGGVRNKIYTGARKASPCYLGDYQHKQVSHGHGKN